MIAPVLLAALLAGAPVPFAGPPPVELWAGEECPADSLAALAKLPAATLGLRLRSNMVRPEAAAVLARRGAGLVRLQPVLARAHEDVLRALPRSTLVVALAGPLPAELAAKLAGLGPQPLRVELAVPLDARIAKSLAPLKNAEVWLDARGRMPDQEELGLLLGLSRVGRVVRLRAEDPPAMVKALRAVRPVRLVVEASEGARLPEAMVAALMEEGLPVRVAVDLRAGPEDLRRLAALPQVSFELALPQDDCEAAVPRARGLLAGLVAGP